MNKLKKYHSYFMILALGKSTVSVFFVIGYLGLINIGLTIYVFSIIIALAALYLKNKK
jgi:hypothetical protein